MKLNAGEKAPEIVNAVIEIPSGSNIKYEMDKESGLIKVDRILYTAMNYPFNYGYIPSTLALDGDPIDILVLSGESFVSGSYVNAVPIGVIHMKDESGEDEKIIAVPVAKVDPVFGAMKGLDAIPEITKRKIIHFFEHYKELEKDKWVKLSGWGDENEARSRINDAMERYSKKQ